MSTVGGSAHVASTSVKAAASAPPYVWMALAVVVAGAVLIWHKFGQDPEDTNWLDPGQPPINVGVDFNTTIPGQSWTAPGAPDTGRRATKPYPFNSLMQHPECWVGDC